MPPTVSRTALSPEPTQVRHYGTYFRRAKATEAIFRQALGAPMATQSNAVVARLVLDV